MLYVSIQPNRFVRIYSSYLNSNLQICASLHHRQVNRTQLSDSFKAFRKIRTVPFFEIFSLLYKGALIA